MSDDVHNQTNSVSMSLDNSHVDSGKVFSQQEVNNILAARLARQEETFNNRFEEERNSLKSSIPNEAEIAARVHAELDSKYRKQAEEQQQAMYADKFRKDKEVFKELVNKVDLGQEQDETGILSPDNNEYIPLQIAFANIDVENKSEILKELSKRPGDVLAANLAAEKGNVTLLRAMFKKINDGIKRNKEASIKSNSYEPLSHLKPSTGGSAGGTLTLKDYKKLIRG